MSSSTNNGKGSDPSGGDAVGGNPGRGVGVVIGVPSIHLAPPAEQDEDAAPLGHLVAAENLIFHGGNYHHHHFDQQRLLLPTRKRMRLPV
jgi:hypothetical protein